MIKLATTWIVTETFVSKTIIDMSKWHMIFLVATVINFCWLLILVIIQHFSSSDNTTGSVQTLQPTNNVSLTND